MATYPLPTIACTVNEFGCTAPSFTDILETLKAEYRGIYGEDAYLEPDSQDGQWVGILARGFHDCNQAHLSIYRSFSPQTAVGVGLSNAVKINHMQRLAASKSTVNLTIGGVAGTLINDGKAGDTDGNRWLLPSVVSIPPAGVIVVTALAENPGAVQAPSASVTSILTPTAGWQTVTNAAPAVAGEPVETDAQLRNRQEIAPALNSKTTLEGIAANLYAIPGVTYGRVYQNDTDDPDANGIPGHSIAAVVQGGDAAAIADVLFRRKNLGVNTYGTTAIDVPNISGGVTEIRFFVPTEKRIIVDIELTAQDGYTTTTAAAIKAAVAAYINNKLEIGESLVVNRLFTPALLAGDDETYVITSLLAAEFGDTPAAITIDIAFNEKATCVPADVTVTVV